MTVLEKSIGGHFKSTMSAAHQALWPLCFFKTLVKYDMKIILKMQNLKFRNNANSD
jgi:hypothetical protein